MSATLRNLGFTCFVILAALPPGCDRPPSYQNTLRLYFDSDPITLDPAMMTDVKSGRLSALLYDTLISYNRHLQLESGLAESWHMDPDAITYRFRLREGLKFTDGTSVTADDVIFSLERLAHPKTASPRSWILSKVKGYNEFRSGSSRHLEGLKKISDVEISIQLRESFAPFLSLLTMPNASIISKTQSDQGLNVGTGPFKLDQWRHDYELLLTKNSFYFRGEPKVDKISFRIIKETLYISSEFRRGALDIMEVPGPEAAYYLENPDWQDQLQTQNNLSLYYLGFNCGRAPLNETESRIRLSSFIHPENIIQSVRKGRSSLLYGPIPPGIEGHRETALIHPKTISNFSRHRTGINRPLILIQSASEETLELSEILQYQLAQAGIPVKIIELEWSAFKERLRNGDFDLFISSWWADYPDAENFLFPLFHSSNIGTGGNYTRFHDPEADLLIEKLQKSSDPREKNELCHQIELRLSKKIPMVFLYSSQSPILTQPWIKNFFPHPLYNGNKFTSVEIKKNALPS